MPQNLPHTVALATGKNKGKNQKKRGHNGETGETGSCSCSSALTAVRKQIWSNKKLKLKVPLQFPTWPVTANGDGMATQFSHEIGRKNYEPIRG